MDAKIEKLLAMDNPMLDKLREINSKVLDQDLSKLTDEELKSLYKECDSTVDYYNGMQLIVKLAANAAYGAVGSIYYRFCNFDVAEDITGGGKLIMMEVDKLINKFFKDWVNDIELQENLIKLFNNPDIKLSAIKRDICVYGDTDSRYINFGDIFAAANFKPKGVKEVIDFILYLDNNYLQKLIREGLKDYIEERGGEVGYMIMELETIGGKGIYLKKKKYVMSLLWKDGKTIADQGKIKATGVEIVQGSSSKFVKDSMKKVIKMLLTPKTKIENVFKMANIIVEQAKTVDPQMLCKTNSANKWDSYIISDYPKTEFRPKISAQLRAAAYFNNFIKLNNLEDKFPKFIDGQKIYWYYTKNHPIYDVFGVPDGIELKEIPNYPEMDYDKQVEKLIINPLKKYIFSGDLENIGFGGDVIQPTFKKQIKL